MPKWSARPGRTRRMAGQNRWVNDAHSPPIPSVRLPRLHGRASPQALTRFSSPWAHTCEHLRCNRGTAFASLQLETFQSDTALLILDGERAAASAITKRAVSAGFSSEGSEACLLLWNLLVNTGDEPCRIRTSSPGAAAQTAVSRPWTSNRSATLPARAGKARAARIIRGILPTTGKRPLRPAARADRAGRVVGAARAPRKIPNSRDTTIPRCVQQRGIFFGDSIAPRVAVTAPWLMSDTLCNLAPPAHHPAGATDPATLRVV